MESDARIPSRTSAAADQSFSWGEATRGRDSGACDWYGAHRTRDCEDRGEISSSAHIHFDSEDFDRRYYRSRSPRAFVSGAGGPSHHRGTSDYVAYVGSVHHHYPNHSSVKAIHPNSQIFRPCYPETPYGGCGSVACESRCGSDPLWQIGCPPKRERGRGEEVLVESPTDRGGSGSLDYPRGSPPPSASERLVAPSCSWSDTQHSRPNQNRCCANCSSAIVREQFASTRRSEVDSSRMERSDPFDRGQRPPFGRADPPGADVEEFRRGGGFLRPEIVVGGGQRMEYSPDRSLDHREGLRRKHPLLHRSQDCFQHGCCAYQHGDLNSHRPLAVRSECSSRGARVEGRREESEGPTGAARQHPPRPDSPILARLRRHPPVFDPSRNFGRDALQRVEVSGERRGEEEIVGVENRSEGDLRLGRGAALDEGWEAAWMDGGRRSAAEECGSKGVSGAEKSGGGVVDPPNQERVTPKEEEAARLPLLQEQLRVLLWALLGSERLQSAADCEGQARGETAHPCWSRTPVQDLLGTILGACDCPQCRPKRCFRDLACSLLNKCPPLSDRLAGGGPEALGRVVASVYHNDLMPSIRRHEADLPDAVRRSMTRVARLEWALNRAPPELSPLTSGKPLSPASCIEEKADRSRDTIILTMQEKLKGLTVLNDGETRWKNHEQEPFNAGIHLKLKEDVGKQRFFGCGTKRPHDWLHPHHQFLMEGLVSDLQPRLTNQGDEIHCTEKRDDQSLKKKHSALNAKSGKYKMPMKMEVPVIRRKRGRPPKTDGKTSIISSPRKKRMLLWKFLITLLDGVEANDHYLKMSTTNQNHSDDMPCILNSNTRNLVEQCKESESSCISTNEHDTTSSFKSSKVCRCEYRSEISSPMLIAETKPCSGMLSLHRNACLQWICREDGLFRILDTADLAKRWGYQHKNPKMTYEKMSRAMRTYYQHKVLVPVPKSYNLPKKLVYKFNPAILKKIPQSSPLSKQKEKF